MISPVVHTPRTVSRFLWRLVSTTHMVSWPLRIWDMASSSTSSACWGIFTACVERVPGCWQPSSALAPWASTRSQPGPPTHGQEVGGLQSNGLIAGGRKDGRLGLGCRGGSDDRGPGQDLKLEGSGVSRQPAQGFPLSPARVTAALIQDTRPSPSLPCLLRLDIRLAPRTVHLWLGWALLPPWLWPCLEIEGQDPWVRSGREMGQAGR